MFILFHAASAWADPCSTKNTDFVDLTHFIYDAAAAVAPPAPDDELLCSEDPANDICSPESPAVSRRMKEIKRANALGVPGVEVYDESVSQTYTEIVSTVIDLVSTRLGVSDAVKNTLITLLNSCRLKQDGSATGAEMAIDLPHPELLKLARLRRDLIYPEKRKINPVLATFPKCEMLLSDDEWRSCGKKEPACYLTLFHEFAHLLSGCAFQTYAINLELLMRDFPDEDLEAMRDLAKTASLIAAELTPDSTCLGRLSAPKDAVFNSCDDSWSQELKQRNAQFLAHCGQDGNPGILPFYPSQWSEAEADFLGATFMSHWFETGAVKSKGFSEKRQLMQDAFADFCAYRNLARERSTRNRFFAPEPDRCEFKTDPELLAPLNAPWNPHQDELIRINRNFLRNTDLRNALGCRLTAKVPFSCSPLGSQTSLK